MGSYGAAKAAAKAALEAGWTTTRIAYQNEVPDEPWPPEAVVPGSSFAAFQPFVFFEMATMPGQAIRGVGMPGNHLSQTNGFFYVHVFVPDGTGEATATQYAEAIGELFRAKVLYQPGDGCYLRCWVPRVDEGGDAAAQSEIAGVNAGNWYRVTVSVPFQYFHRG
ncbi:phage tail terminator-like protein [Devosia sp. A449]